MFEPNHVPTTEEELDNLRQEISALQERVEAIENDNTMSIQESPPDDPANAEVSALRSDIDDINTRLTAIEQTILEDPGRVLEITLIKRDIDDINENLELIRQEINQTTNRFIIPMLSLAGALVFAILPSFITSIRTIKRNGKSEATTQEAPPQN